MSERVVYTVELKPLEHEMRVEMIVRGKPAEGDVPLQIPTWVPG